MRRALYIFIGLFAFLAIVGSILSYTQRERWSQSYVIAEIYSVGQRRIEMRGMYGEVIFAEITPATQVWSGPREITAGDLKSGMTVMVLGSVLTAERVDAETIRLLNNYKIKRLTPKAAPPKPI